MARTPGLSLNRSHLVAFTFLKPSFKAEVNNFKQRIDRVYPLSCLIYLAFKNISYRNINIIFRTHTQFVLYTPEALIPSEDTASYLDPLNHQRGMYLYENLLSISHLERFLFVSTKRIYYLLKEILFN